MSLFDTFTPDPPLAPSLGPPARTRTTDPQTSRIAAESLPAPVLSEQKRTVLWLLHQFEIHGGHGGTTHEMVVRLSYEHPVRHVQQSVLSSRCSQLHDMGLIEDTRETRPGGTGRPLIVWALTETGREAATS